VDIERAIEFMLEQGAKADARLAELSANVGRHDKEMAQIRNILRRAIRASVEEQRRERVRRQQMEARLDEKITQLAAAQLLAEEETRELRKTFENWLRRQNGNGYPPPA
jgi:NAD-specific glutamate dehydrogenase